jgi:hypothetical protein
MRSLIEFAGKNEAIGSRRENCHAGFDAFYAKRISADKPLTPASHERTYR